MNKRQHELSEIKEYIQNIDKETTLLLQNLQWDHKHLLESTEMVSCKYLASHRIPKDTREAHEEQCYLTLQGYSKEDVLLPDPIDPDANTVVKLNKQDIEKIINTASSSNPSFKRGVACPGPEPLTVERLQQVYTADERCAIHDAVVTAAPACHDLTDLALASASDGPQTSKSKSRAEILAELRDMKRRRTKYRVAAKTRNYSDMLKDVIKAQMELFAEAKGIFIKTEYGSKTYASLNRSKERTDTEKIPTSTIIKQERVSPDADNYGEGYRSRRYRERSKSRDRRRRHGDREAVSRRRQDQYDDTDHSSEKRRYKDISQERDKYGSKESKRHDDRQSKRDKYTKTKEGTLERRNRHDDGRKNYKNTHVLDPSIDSSYEDRRKHSKHDREYGNGSSDGTYKYDASSREHDKHESSYKDISTRGSSKNDNYNRKRAEYQRFYKDSDRHREKYKRRYDVEIKQEKDDA